VKERRILKRKKESENFRSQKTEEKEQINLGRDQFERHSI